MSTRPKATTPPSVSLRTAFLGRALRKLNLPGRHHPGSAELIEPGREKGGLNTGKNWAVHFCLHHDSLPDWHCFQALPHDPSTLSENDVLALGDEVAQYVSRSLSHDRAPWVLVGSGAMDDRYPGRSQFVAYTSVPGLDEWVNVQARYTRSPEEAKLFGSVEDAQTMREMLGGPALMVEPRYVF